MSTRGEKHPPMTWTWRHDGTNWYVTIVHGMNQSYSRAVHPKAMQLARVTLPRVPNRWTLVSIDHDAPAPEGRAASTFHFKPEPTKEGT